MTMYPRPIAQALLLAVALWMTNTVAAQVFSLTVDDATYDPLVSGTRTFTLTYTGSIAENSSLGFDLTGPTGWSFVSATNLSAGSFLVGPVNGDTGTLEWAWQNGSSAQSSLTYQVALDYNAGTITAGTQTITMNGYAEGGSFVNSDSVALTAVPEPSTYAAILGACVLALAGWRRYTAAR